MKSLRNATAIFDRLDDQHPGADTELHFSNAYELLAATILAAQSTDRRVNMVTPTLFKRYPTPAALAAATPEALEPQIHSTGFFRAKSRSLIGMAKALVNRHGGKVPADMDALVDLPGVGRKTANVVLGHALGIPGLPVDRHVLRVSNRIGLAEGGDAGKVETQLCALLPPARWTRASDTMILHGRRVCRPKPLCADCQVQEFCVYFRTGATTDVRKATGADARQGRKATRPRSTEAARLNQARSEASAGAGARKPKGNTPATGTRKDTAARSARRTK